MNTRSTRSKSASMPVELPEEIAEKVPKVTKKPKSAKLQNTDALVASIISSIKEETAKDSAASTGNADANNGENNKPTNKDAKKSVVKNKPNAVKSVRGLPKSGRPWKEVKQKFSTIKKTMKRRPFEKKEQLRHELKHIKELSNSIKEDKKTR